MSEKEIHTVGLGQVRKVAPRNRASKAMKILREYVDRHTSAGTVSVSNAVNERLWENGARNPPRSVEIQVAVEEGTAHVELADLELEVEEEPEPEVEYTELEDEDIAEMNVGEVKELVEDGTIEAERALDIEYAGKNRKTLISWLKERVEDAEDEGEEPEVTEEEEEEVEEAAESEGEEVEREDSDETYDLPGEVVETFEEGTIGEGKDAARELGKDEFEKLLNFEEAHQNRKGMKKFLRSNMN
ncbi:MAG: 50S ribosomal protein L31e [Candidatus Nanohaloarchaea archaeon]|nr:50S ribosomal protein L31e [Candidatus Nanohaloarchaea archaeon]